MGFMLIHYLKVALRNLLRYKVFSCINIVALALAMSVCLISIMQIADAFQYDSFHPHPERLYRILTDVRTRQGNLVSYASSPLPLAKALQEDYGFIDKVISIYPGISGMLQTDNKTLPADGLFVDSSFFEAFGFGLSVGQPATAPRTIVLTKQLARRFFGNENPVGKTVQMEKLGLFTVSGILQSIPGKSHLQFDVLASMATLPMIEATHQESIPLRNWEDYEAAYTYVLLKNEQDKHLLEKALSKVAAQAMQAAGFQHEKTYTFRTQEFSHISPGREKLMNLTHEPIVVNLLTVATIAFSVLLLAIFNYITLTLARSLHRNREVGVRKIIGAKRSQLVYQFIVESVLGMFLAIAVACCIFGQIKKLAVVGQITGDMHWNPTLWLVTAGFSLLVGILAGIVPARVLSAAEPVNALHEQPKLRMWKALHLRKVLIVAQFSASLVALVFMGVFYRQTSFMATASYGFNQKDILSISLQGQSYALLSQKMAAMAGVEKVSASSNLPGMPAKSQPLWKTRDQVANTAEAVVTYSYAVDTNFVSMMGLTLLSGTNIGPSALHAHKREVIINEQAVSRFALGDPLTALGQTLWLNDSTAVQIIGVVKDFRYQSFLYPIAPLVLAYQPEKFTYLNLKVTKGLSENIRQSVEQVWKQTAPYQALSAGWLEKQVYEKNFQREDQLFMGMLTAIALSIACLGLLGIVLYSTQTRTREVGIRKVLGAGIVGIIFLLSKEFVGLLLIAGAIGLPTGYYVANLFLQQYAYHVPIGFETLLVCFVSVLLIGCLLIGIQTVRAAMANPTKILRAA